MAIVRAASELAEFTKGEGEAAKTYRLAVPTRLLRVALAGDFERELAIAGASLAAGEAGIVYRDEVAMAELALEIVPGFAASAVDLTEMKKRIGAYRAAAEKDRLNIPGDVLEAFGEIETALLKTNDRYAEAAFHRTAYLESRASAVLRRFVRAIDGEDPLPLEHGRLTEAGLERIPVEHRMSVYLEIEGLMRPSEDEEKN